MYHNDPTGAVRLCNLSRNYLIKVKLSKKIDLISYVVLGCLNYAYKYYHLKLHSVSGLNFFLFLVSDRCYGHLTTECRH